MSRDSVVVLVLVVLLCTGMGGMAALYQLLDGDQPFLCMLRMILVSMREEDDGGSNMLTRNVSINEGSFSGSRGQDGSALSSLENSPRTSMRQPRSALLSSVLSPLLNMPISESSDRECWWHLPFYIPRCGTLLAMKESLCENSI